MLTSLSINSVIETLRRALSLALLPPTAVDAGAAIDVSAS
jgi:hypothetical protein